MKITLNNILRWVPVLGIIVESYVVGVAIERETAWSIYIVFVSSLLVAGTGFGGVQIMTAMAEFNATIKRDELAQKFQLPVWKSYVVLTIWFAGVIALTIFLDVSDTLVAWTPVGLVVIGFSASYLSSLSNLYATRSEERDAYRQAKANDKKAKDANREEQRNADRQLKKELATKRKEMEKTLKDKGVKVGTKGNAKVTNELLLLYWAGDPHLSNQQMADKLVSDGHVDEITRQAISGRLKGMVKSGLAVVTDADGVMQPISVGQGSGVEAPVQEDES